MHSGQAVCSLCLWYLCRLKCGAPKKVKYLRDDEVIISTAFSFTYCWMKSVPLAYLGIVPLKCVNLSKHGGKVRQEERGDFLPTPFFTFFLSLEHHRNAVYTGKTSSTLRILIQKWFRKSIQNVTMQKRTIRVNSHLTCKHQHFANDSPTFHQCSGNVYPTENELILQFPQHLCQCF